jgi:2-phospho-L-lactate guanylyltransferase
MKAFAAAKTRLRPRLSDDARRALARTMFENVVRAAGQCEDIDRVCVVTHCDEVAALTHAAGGCALRDPAPDMGLGALMDWALAQWASVGAKRAVILMSDLPRVEARDITELCKLLDKHDCVIVPDRRGESTNALALRLPWPCATAFGRPDSYRAHASLADVRGLNGRVLSRERLAHDIDIIDDLEYTPPATVDWAQTAPQVARRQQDW